MRQVLLSIGLMVSVAFGFAQETRLKVEQRSIKKGWTVDPHAFKDDFHLSLTHLEAPFPGGDVAKSEIKQLKAESDGRYPRLNGAKDSQRDVRETNDSLRQLEHFPVRFFINDAIMTGGTPNDNTLAISNGGMLITSYNTQLWAYDLEADSFLFHYNARHPSFGQFMETYNDTTFSLYFPFDPKLLYDPVNDRFIMVFLTGRDPSNSGVVVCFSSTNYPTDLWHAYYLSGNPFNDSTWTDYPQIAINEHSLYLTLNQLYPDSSWITGFAQTICWQMDLDAGFSGAEELPVKLWSGFNHNGSKLRYLHPVKTALGPESDTMYFVANRPFAIENDSFFIIEMTGDVTDTNLNVDVRTAISDVNYGLPPDAMQAAGHTFNTNDARVLGAVRINREIQFVGNCKDFDSGKATIFYGLIENVESPAVQGRVLQHDDLEFGYPNIDFLGHTKKDKETIIFFNHTSPTRFAGNSAIYCSNDRAFGPLQVLVEGTTYVDRISGTDERWGDYIGLQRKYNETSRVWAAGYVSFGNKVNGTYVSELAGPRDWPSGLASTVNLGQTRSFPNPTMDIVTLQFEMPSTAIATIDVYDANGKLVKKLARDRIKAGKNELNLDLTPLERGMYFIRVGTEQAVLMNEKIIKD